MLLYVLQRAADAAVPASQQQGPAARMQRARASVRSVLCVRAFSTRSSTVYYRYTL